jgi:sugar (pentulose or hexulose) kinase
VGTYLVDFKEVISWNDPMGKEELDEILASVSREEFISETGMPHPCIISYPLPRLLYIKRHFEGAKYVCQPKDWLCYVLGGRYLTDKFSWRGLANLGGKGYSDKLLKKFGLEEFKLPELCNSFDTCFEISREGSEKSGLPEGTSCFVGCNDFFAGLLGMGVINEGDAFDITGTSEHLGVLTAKIPDVDDTLVCGPYFRHNAHYGVTQSSGKSLDFAMNLYDLDSIDAEKCLRNSPPVFLPYLCGERAPIWDKDARGVFFGIGDGCDKETLAYSVMEGVCFSIYHIYETMGKPPISSLTVSGGAAKNNLMNKMKASLFTCPVYVPEETDSSAYGAMILASVGSQDFNEKLCDTVNKLCKKRLSALPDEALGKRLRNRFEIYKSLYPALKDQFSKL